MFSCAHLVPFFYLPVMTSHHAGVSMEVGTTVLTFFGVGSILGRLALGVVVNFKWIGHLTFGSLGFLCCAICNMLSAFLTSYWGMATVSAMNGFGMGTYVSMISVAGADLFGVKMFPTVFSMCFSIGAFGFLFSPALLGYFHELVNDGDVLVMGITAGFFTMASILCLTCKFIADKQARSEQNTEVMPLLK